MQELLHYRSASFAARPSGDKSKVSCVTVFRVCVSVSGQFSRGKIIRRFIHRGKEYCYSWNLFRARKTLNFDGKHYAPSVLKRGASCCCRDRCCRRVVIRARSIFPNLFNGLFDGLFGDEIYYYKHGPLSVHCLFEGSC